MAKFYIREYARLGQAANGKGDVPLEPGIDQTPLTVGATSEASEAFNAETHLVEVHTDVICSIVFGADPTATADHMRLAAGETRRYGVHPGHKVAVITNT